MATRTMASKRTHNARIQSKPILVDVNWILCMSYRWQQRKHIGNPCILCCDRVWSESEHREDSNCRLWPIGFVSMPETGRLCSVPSTKLQQSEKKNCHVSLIPALWWYLPMAGGHMKSKIFNTHWRWRMLNCWISAQKQKERKKNLLANFKP